MIVIFFFHFFLIPVLNTCVEENTVERKEQKSGHKTPYNEHKNPTLPVHGIVALLFQTM